MLLRVISLLIVALLICIGFAVCRRSEDPREDFTNFSLAAAGFAPAKFAGGSGSAQGAKEEVVTELETTSRADMVAAYDDAAGTPPVITLDPAEYTRPHQDRALLDQYGFTDAPETKWEMFQRAAPLCISSNQIRGCNTNLVNESDGRNRQSACPIFLQRFATPNDRFEVGTILPQFRFVEKDIELLEPCTQAKP
jgi:hypothetical protein